ncbi:MAG: hypothetical protein R6U89_10205 [Dehalococcoidia bacterium]
MGFFSRKKEPKDRFGNIMGDYEMNVRLWAGNRQEMYGWQAFGAGTLRLFEEIRKTIPFKGIADSHEKARLLMELGVQPMITIWNHEMGTAESRSEEGIRALLSTSQHLIDEKMWSLRADAVDMYVGFDTGLQSYLSGEGDMGDVYAGTFQSRYFECITGKSFIHWDQLDFPVRSMSDLLDACSPDNEFEPLSEDETRQFLDSLDMAGKHMLETLDHFNKEWEDWSD